MTDEKLKPCPFCGGKPLIYKSMPDRRAWVMCSECGATSPSGFREKTAIKAWNRRTIEEMSEEHRKKLERANIERTRLLKHIEELENVNAELVRSVPEDAPVGDDTESKLEYAFLTLHLTDREAAEYAGCAPARAWRYRKDKGINPKGG